MPPEQFETSAPLLELPLQYSARGLVTQMRLQHRAVPDIHQKILSTMIENNTLRGHPQSFEWDLRQLPNTPEEVTVQASKLTDYLLDPDHKRGKSKALFFANTLGITRDDWSFLQSQFVDALASVRYENVHIDAFGIRFTALLPIKGRNDATATVETGWIVRPGERASFITAFPSVKDRALEERASAPAVVRPHLSDEAKWSAIYELAEQAGNNAISTLVPTPIVVDGVVYMEGNCGGAYVAVKDARRGFAKWLKNSGKGRKCYPTGYAVYAPAIDQSAERAEAFAKAFASVLRRNHISCSVETYLS